MLRYTESGSFRGVAVILSNHYGAKNSNLDRRNRRDTNEREARFCAATTNIRRFSKA